MGHALIEGRRQGNWGMGISTVLTDRFDRALLYAAHVHRGRVCRAQTRRFRGVPLAAWSFHIGGYQVREKWLNDRRGRTLSKEEIAHYQKMVCAPNETIRLMGEIDEVIDAHGGWPGAFATRQLAEAWVMEANAGPRSYGHPPGG
jgi:hypothetical protein